MIEGVEVICAQGAVATGPAGGARSGAQILEAGGNAMDAAAAASLACAVLEPQAVDIGGYVASAVVLDGKTGRVWSIDGNAVAPRAAREDMFEVLPPTSGHRGINEIEYGCSVAEDANVYGPLSVAVPGFIGGVGTLWERWGRLQWPAIVAPARELLENLRYGLVREAVLLKRDVISRFPSTAEILLPAGVVPSANDHWSRPDLARTLDRLSAAGWRDFYDGEIGRLIADFVSAAAGILTREDMAGFAPRVTEPLSSKYRNADLYTAIRQNGGFSVLSTLQAIEPFDALSDGDPRYWARFAHALEYSWRERLRERPARASRYGTIHVASADSSGNMVSMTLSQGGLFGSCLAVPDTGIILGHGMCRFDPHPGLENSPGPGKRPLNNVCPLLIRTAERDVAVGLRGGRRIVSVCAQLAQRIVDYGASVQEAAAAPRIHTMTCDPLEISHNFDMRMRQSLEQLGWRIEVPNEIAGAAHGAEILKRDRLIRAGGNTWAAGI